MLKSSFLDILRTFSKEDLSAFEDFINSPFHNKKSNVVKLYKAIIKYAPAFSNEKLAKEEVWKKIFPAKKYNYGIMKNLIHDLTKLSESYLSHSNFNSGLSFDRHLIKELYNRNSYNAFLNKLEKFEDKNINTKSESSEYLYNKFFSDNIKFEYLENITTLADNHNEIFKNLILYFTHYLFKFGNSVYLEEYRSNIKHDYPFIKVIVEYINSNQELLNDSPWVKINYYLLLCFLNNGDEEILKNMLEVFNNSKDKLSEADKLSAYILVENGFEMHFRKGIVKYEKDFLKHLIEMVEQNIYKDAKNNYPDLYMFLNVFAVAYRNKDSEMMKKFINDNIHKLQHEKRISVMNYGLSHASFLEKDYEKVIKYSSGINHNDFFEKVQDNRNYKIGTKVLIACSYYELNYLESVLTEIDSALHFINNNKQFNSVHSVPKENFFKVLRKITLLNLKYDKFKMDKIRGEIDELKKSGLAQHAFLSEKISELEKRNK